MSENDYDAAYQQFMMGGGKKGATTTPTMKTPPTKIKPSLSSSSSSSPAALAPAAAALLLHKTPFRSVLKSFQATLQYEWIDVDDNLGDVMHSIVNLRDRIYWSSEIFLMTHQSPHHHHHDNHDDDNHKNHNGVYLHSDDIELALSHDMEQHEKMMAGARSLLSNMNTAQEALGRRLDEMMRIGNDAYNNNNNNKNNDGQHYQQQEHQVAYFFLLQSLYRKLADELYHKQVAVLKVLQSTNDHLLCSEEDTQADSSCSNHSTSASANMLIDDDDNPRYMAQTCWSKWCRTSQLELVKEVLALK